MGVEFEKLSPNQKLKKNHDLCWFSKGFGCTGCNRGVDQSILGGSLRSEIECTSSCKNLVVSAPTHLLEVVVYLPEGIRPKMVCFWKI